MGQRLRSATYRQIIVQHHKKLTTTNMIIRAITTNKGETIDRYTAYFYKGISIDKAGKQLALGPRTVF
jgi:hypothetical protein